MPRTLLVASGTAAAFVCAPVVTSTQPSESKAHVMVTPSTVTCGPGPAALPAGTQAAVLEGDPAKAGPFNVQLKMPDGYKIAPHYHPADEHVTVLQGTFVMGMGEKFDQTAGRKLTVGSVAMMPTGTRHFAWTKGETILQLHGIGPWNVTYVNPSDDPRKKPSE